MRAHSRKTLTLRILSKYRDILTRVVLNFVQVCVLDKGRKELCELGSLGWIEIAPMITKRNLRHIRKVEMFFQEAFQLMSTLR